MLKVVNKNGVPEASRESKATVKFFRPKKEKKKGKWTYTPTSPQKYSTALFQHQSLAELSLA